MKQLRLAFNVTTAKLPAVVTDQVMPSAAARTRKARAPTSTRARIVLSQISAQSRFLPTRLRRPAYSVTRERPLVCQPDLEELHLAPRTLPAISCSLILPENVSRPRTALSPPLPTRPTTRAQLAATAHSSALPRLMPRSGQYRTSLLRYCI